MSMRGRAKWWEPFVVEDSWLCSLCGGLCCKANPGLYLDPVQFVEAWELPAVWEMLPVLEENYLTLKLCMGVPIPLPVVTGRGCIFLGSQGCLLPRQKRPLGCLVLVPSEESVLEGEPLCSLPKELSCLRCFERWRRHYQKAGIWDEVLELAHGLSLS